MRHALASAPAVEPPASQLAAYVGVSGPRRARQSRLRTGGAVVRAALAGSAGVGGAPVVGAAAGEQLDPPVHHVLDGDPTAAAGLRLSGGASTARCCLK